MNAFETPYHLPVMLNESLEGLNLLPSGTYVDVTFGGGGHSQAILSKLTEGTLVAFDQDDDARKNADALAYENLVFIQANFRFLKKYLRLHGIQQVNGILADLGVSSHHFDDAERGFSIRAEGELDMRMNQTQELSAKQVINEYSEEALSNIFWYYGEIRKARTLAKAVVRERTIAPIETTEAFKKIVKPFAQRGKEHKFLAQVFQAIRIEVNDELEALRNMLQDTAEVLQPGGRLVVISYHSLEDRLVKHYMKTGNYEGELEKDMYGNILRPFKPVQNKAIKASAEEVARNSRARSARLRIAERTDFSSQTAMK